MKIRSDTSKDADAACNVARQAIAELASPITKRLGLSRQIAKLIPTILRSLIKPP